MKYVSLILIVLCSFAAGISYKEGGFNLWINIVAVLINLLGLTMELVRIDSGIEK